MSQWRRERVWWFAYSRLDTVGGVLVLISAAKPAGTPLRARRRPPSRREQTRERCMRRTVFPIPEFTAEDSRRDYSPKVAFCLPTSDAVPSPPPLVAAGGAPRAHPNKRRIFCATPAVNVSFDPRQPEREWIRERAILISLLSQRQRVTLQSVRVGDEHTWTHHRRILRSDR